jgi:hypothetical protein
MQVMMIQNILMNYGSRIVLFFFVKDDGCVKILQKHSNKARFNKWVQYILYSSFE